MSHINYNHLYYFWHVYKEGSVVGAAEALFLTPQTITGQIKALEERLQGKLFKRKGRGLEPSELGELVFRYADRMFTLSQEMLDIVNYRKESNLLFDVGVADALSKRLVSGVLDAAVVESEQIHLRCFESTHELLLEQLSQHKLDMIISDCPIDSTQQEGLFSVKIGECSVSFWCMNPPPEKPPPPPQNARAWRASRGPADRHAGEHPTSPPPLQAACPRRISSPAGRSGPRARHPPGRTQASWENRYRMGIIPLSTNPCFK